MAMAVKSMSALLPKADICCRRPDLKLRPLLLAERWAVRHDNKVEAANEAASVTSLGSMVVIMACRRAVLDHLWAPFGLQAPLDRQRLLAPLVPGRRVVLGDLAALAGPQNIQPM